jgi:hypothetical protein
MKNKAKPAGEATIELWADMRVQKFSNITASGIALAPSPGFPQSFIPVFDTREEAVRWAGSDKYVTSLIVTS